jgi:ABC-type transport system involved in multi-copper enzyme maturation permease subunit
MSTATSIDTTRPGVPLGRLIRVELRKSVDTLAGRWLLIAIALITIAANVIFVIVAPDDSHTLTNFFGVSGTPQGFLLPILGILLVTSEWSQRTAMVTFSLAPRRMQTIWAKLAAAIVLGTLVYLVALAIGSLLTAVAGGGPDPWDVSAIEMGQFYLGQIIGVVQGVAFGLLILNSPAAIVIFLFVPIVFSIITSFWSAVRDAQPWIDLGTSSFYLFDGGTLSGEQWAQLATSSGIWLFLPLVLGIVRVLRTEVK